MNRKNKRKLIGTRDRKVTRTNNVPHTPATVRKTSEPLTLQQALTLFLRAKETEGVRPRTVCDYINHVGYLSDIIPDTIRDYITYIRTQKRRYENSEGRKDKTVGLSVNTLNIRPRTISTMAKFWHEEGYLDYNPMENVKQVKAFQEDEVPGLT
ncbi:hypothetical protein [Oceanobacillus sp. 1P07AA]|uniref:hypothetical protein n=1 Tax=Oceanobacillus sp. 1P07AA TaxID=3132293 RepID=UPI0039A421BB